MWYQNECKQIAESLWEYSAGRLPLSETARIDRHIDVCERCRAEAAAVSQTAALLAAARHAPVPASLSSWRDLHPRLPEVRHSLSPRRSADLLPRLTLGGAGMALAATLAVVFVSGPRPSWNSSRREASPTIVERGSFGAGQSIDRTSAERSPAGPTVESFLASAFARMPAVSATGAPPVAAERPAGFNPGPAAPRRRLRIRPGRFVAARSRQEHAEPASASTRLDGEDAASRRPVHNYVLNPVSAASEDGTVRRYVLSSITTQPGGITTVASGSVDEEGRAW